MTKIQGSGLMACLAACATLSVAGAAMANDQQGEHQGEQTVRCNNQTLGAVTIDGNLVVPSGSFCVLNGTHVEGNATVQSGPPEPSQPTGLNSNGGTIDETVYVQRNAQFAAVSGSLIGEDVRCDKCEVADVQDSTVKGNQVDNGVSEGSFIRNSHFGGYLRILNGTDFFNTGFHIDANTTGRDLVFNRNTSSSGSDISGNMIGESLRCNDNTPPPVGTGNMAEHKQGQCTLL